jgi:hypothetical protein
MGAITRRDFMEPINYVFMFLNGIFWFLAVASPVALFFQSLAPKFCDKVETTVISGSTEWHEYDDEVGDGKYVTRTYKTYKVTYAYEYQGASFTFKRDKMRPRIVGSKSFAYVNHKTVGTEHVLDADSYKISLIAMGAGWIGSVLVLVLVAPLFSNMLP